ncbi:MAG: aldo/keto reductase [Rhodospirillaceae bacterium]|nr:aldo/keto reductase [Rhodospirillaceae bacterium]
MTVERCEIAPGLEVSRIWKGGWHLSGGHGTIDFDAAVDDIAAFVEAGITTLDVADIYTGVEDMVGAFRKKYPALAQRIEINDKAVADYDSLETVTGAELEAAVDRSLARLGVPRIDMLQFAWWDPKRGDYVAAAKAYDAIRKKGKTRYLGAINFRTSEIAAMLDAGVELKTHQIQYSLIDDRPERSGHVALCLARGIKLTCYGVVAGGFISERWLGQPEPLPPFANRSLTKYKLIIEDFGGWDLFQELLRSLKGIADKHRTSIANVAMRAMLDKPAVGTVIIGAVNRNHLADHLELARVRLDDADRAAIAAVTAKRQGPDGDVYDLERDKTGRHGRIMKYNINAGRD